MAIRFSIPLHANAEQLARLDALQTLFTEACNALTPVVRKTRCWNRVGLHHMVYRQLRERFPQLGSQMACNAIYSVSRAARKVYQSPQSPWLASRQNDGNLPLIRFEGGAPVYFDRHTLSLRDGQVSMFTLDGRMRFQVSLGPEQHALFVNERLREVVLQKRGGVYSLAFEFGSTETVEDVDVESDDQLPEYLVVQQTPAVEPSDLPGDIPEQPVAPPANGRGDPLLTGVA